MMRYFRSVDNTHSCPRIRKLTYDQLEHTWVWVKNIPSSSQDSKTLQPESNIWRAYSNGYLYKQLPHQRFGLHSERAGRRIITAKGQGVLCETGSPSDVRCYTHKVSITLLLKHELNRAGTVHMPEWAEGSPGEASAHTRNYRQLRMLWAGATLFSRDEHINLLSSTNWSALESCMQAILYRLNMLYLGIYTHTHTHM